MPALKELRRFEMGGDNHIRFVLSLNLVSEWREDVGKCWDCDLCGIEFQVGDVIAEYQPREEDVGCGGNCDTRGWFFSRIHDWHLELPYRLHAARN